MVKLVPKKASGGKDKEADRDCKGTTEGGIGMNMLEKCENKQFII